MFCSHKRDSVKFPRTKSSLLQRVKKSNQKFVVENAGQ